MKHIWKKLACMALALVCVLSLTACGGSKAAEDEVSEEMKTTLLQSAQGLSESIVILSDEEIETYIETGDEFTVSAMEAWNGSREELGALTEFGEGTVEKDGTEYTVTLPGTFEGADADFVYIFDKTGIPTSLSVDVSYSMAVSMERAALNTVMGLGVVFIVLIFLSFVISLFKYIPNPELKQKEEAKKAAAAPAPAPAVLAAPAAESQTDDGELVAVIAAAIAAAEGTSPDGFVVRSIRKVNRKKW